MRIETMTPGSPVRADASGQYVEVAIGEEARMRAEDRAGLAERRLDQEVRLRGS